MNIFSYFTYNYMLLFLLLLLLLVCCCFYFIVIIVLCYNHHFVISFMLHSYVISTLIYLFLFSLLLYIFIILKMQLDSIYFQLYFSHICCLDTLNTYLYYCISVNFYNFNLILFNSCIMLSFSVTCNSWWKWDVILLIQRAGKMKWIIKVKKVLFFVIWTKDYIIICVPKSIIIYNFL